MQSITNIYTLDQFAQVYGGGEYDTSTYGGNSSTKTSSTGGSSTAATSGTLTNTGLDILIVVTLACFLIFLALVVRFWKKPKKQPPQPVA